MLIDPFLCCKALLPLFRRDPEVRSKEFEVGKNLAEKAKEAGVTHFLWSSLPNADRLSGGKWVRHCASGWVCSFMRPSVAAECATAETCCAD